VGYGGGLNEKLEVEVEVEVEVEEVDVVRGGSGGVQVRDWIISHGFKRKFIFLLEERRFLRSVASSELAF
jgi:hypothetical protein